MSKDKKPNWTHVPDAWLVDLYRCELKQSDFHAAIIHIGECKVCRERAWEKCYEIHKSHEEVKASIAKATQSIGGLFSKLMSGEGLTTEDEPDEDEDDDDGHNALPSDEKAEEWIVKMIRGLRPLNEIERMRVLRRVLHLPAADHVTRCKNCQKRYSALFAQLYRITDKQRSLLPEDVETIDGLVTLIKTLHEEHEIAMKAKSESGSGPEPKISLS
jgi:hypothetical protein